MPNIYATTDGSPLALTQVKERAESTAAATRAEYEAAVEAVRVLDVTLAESDGKGKAHEAKVAAHAAAVKERDALAVSAKSGYKFSPAKGRKVNRYAVDAETLNKWLSAEDADERAAILATVDTANVHPQKSAIAPSVAAYADMRAGWLSRVEGDATRQAVTAVMLSDISRGTLVVPNAGRGASSPNAVKMTPEQKRDAAAAAMFADLPDAPEDDAPETPETPANAGETA